MTINALIGIIIILVIVLISTIVYYKVKIYKFSIDFNNVLDDIISQKDIDFKISNETLISKLHLKLKRLYEILQDKNEYSKKQHENLQSLISDISHQIKTPIANLKMYNQILVERELTTEQRTDFLKLLNKQTDKLDFLINSLFKISKLENGIISFKLKKVSIQDILSNALVQIIPFAESKNIDISVNCSMDNFAICDIKWTSEVIFNILDNAIKYTHEDDTIEIFTEMREFYTIIHIKDNGIGICEKEQPLIFTRFYRSKDVQDTNGIGIGLFLAQKIIFEQNGFIQVKSEVGKGSEFLIHLRNE